MSDFQEYSTKIMCIALRHQKLLYLALETKQLSGLCQIAMKNPI